MLLVSSLPNNTTFLCNLLVTGLQPGPRSASNYSHRAASTPAAPQPCGSRLHQCPQSCPLVQPLYGATSFMPVAPFADSFRSAALRTRLSRPAVSPPALKGAHRGYHFYLTFFHALKSYNGRAIGQRTAQ